MVVKIHLNARQLHRLQGQIEPRAERIIDKTAFLVEGDARNNCPKDTGALANSHYTVTARSSGLAAAQTAARRLNPLAGIVEIPPPTQKLVARVGPSVEYAVHVHWGTIHMAGRPFLLNALKRQEPHWSGTWRQLFEGF